jgi:urease accessory protein
MTAHRYRAFFPALLLLPATTFAHSGAEVAGVMQGFAHPFGGLDHLLAGIAVGMLASRFDGSRRWLLPLAFLFAMGVGGLIGSSGLPLPFVEVFIALSLVAFGISIVSTRAPRFAFAASIVGALALFHGHAHGNEISGASVVLYSSGLFTATALLHGVGLWLTLQLTEVGRRARNAVRITGGSIALTGFVLLGVLAS